MSHLTYLSADFERHILCTCTPNSNTRIAAHTRTSALTHAAQFVLHRILCVVFAHFRMIYQCSSEQYTPRCVVKSVYKYNCLHSATACSCSQQVMQLPATPEAILQKCRQADETLAERENIPGVGMFLNQTVFNGFSAGCAACTLRSVFAACYDQNRDRSKKASALNVIFVIWIRHKVQKLEKTKENEIESLYIQ